jgi:hypothetical protein
LDRFGRMILKFENGDSRDQLCGVGRRNLGELWHLPSDYGKPTLVIFAQLGEKGPNRHPVLKVSWFSHQQELAGGWVTCWVTYT